MPRDIPLRANLFALAPEQHVLLLVLHHIAADGGSLAALARDLATAYAARRVGAAPAWTPLPVQYADYTLWQRTLLGAENDPDSRMAGQIAFWTDSARRPAGATAAADRSTRVRRSQAIAGIRCRSTSAQHLQQRLLALARDSHASLFMVLQAALAALLTRHGAGTDIPIGSPIAGRSDHALDELIGCFVNTLVLRTDTAGNPSFRELLTRVRATNLRAYAHQDLPFERLVETAEPGAVASAASAVPGDAGLPEPDRCQPGHAGAQRRLPADARSMPPSSTWPSLSPNGAPRTARRLASTGCWSSAPTCSSATPSARIADRLVRLLEAVVEDPDVMIGRLDLLAPRERRHVLNDWNDTATPTSAAIGFPALFEAQAAARPGRDRPGLRRHDAQLCRPERTRQPAGAPADRPRHRPGGRSSPSRCRARSA